jgi:hypothetical protein
MMQSVKSRPSQFRDGIEDGTLLGEDVIPPTEGPVPTGPGEVPEGEEDGEALGEELNEGEEEGEIRVVGDALEDGALLVRSSTKKIPPTSVVPTVTEIAFGSPESLSVTSVKPTLFVSPTV